MSLMRRPPELDHLRDARSRLGRRPGQGAHFDAAAPTTDRERIPAHPHERDHVRRIALQHPRPRLLNARLGGLFVG